MESIIVGNYNYNQLIIKHDEKNARKIVIQKQLKKQQQQQSSFPHTQTFLLQPHPTPTPHLSSAGTQIYKPENKQRKKMSKHFDVKLMDSILPWFYSSNSLREAAKKGNLNLVIELIKNGADVNEADRFGNTPLWLAYVRDHYRIVVELLNAGANVNLKTGDFEISDLHRACGWGTISFVKFLLKCDGQVNITDIYGKTPFIFTIDFKSNSNCLELIELLHSFGALVNHQDISGLTSLHYACIRGKVDVVEKLLKLNASPYSMNSINYSPLTYSLCYISYMPLIDNDSFNNRLRIVKLLINSIETAKMKHCIIGTDTTPNLVALFNFIFFGLSQSVHSIEKLGWSFYNEIIENSDTASRQIIDNQLFTIAQYLIMYNQNLHYFIYFVQRTNLAKLSELLLFYLINFYNEKKNYLRINLLIIYSLLSDNGEALKYVISNDINSYPSENNEILEVDNEAISVVGDDQHQINDEQLAWLNHQLYNTESTSTIQSLLSSILKVKAKKPFSLKCLSRRALRNAFQHSIYSAASECNIPVNLKNYILYHELNNYAFQNDISMKFLFEFISKL